MVRNTTQSLFFDIENVCACDLIKEEYLSLTMKISMNSLLLAASKLPHAPGKTKAWLH